MTQPRRSSGTSSISVMGGILAEARGGVLQKTDVLESARSDEQRRRRDARQRAAVTGEVRLVGVAGVGGHATELPARARGGQRALEAQDAAQALGAVADRRGEAPAQLALADEQLVRQRADRHR